MLKAQQPRRLIANEVRMKRSEIKPIGRRFESYLGSHNLVSEGINFFLFKAEKQKQPIEFMELSGRVQRKNNHNCS